MHSHARKSVKIIYGPQLTQTWHACTHGTYTALLYETNYKQDIMIKLRNGLFKLFG